MLSTIASLKADGLTGVWAICDRHCRPDVAIPWERIGLPDDTPYLRISTLRTFRCQGCGHPGRIMPDWRGQRPMQFDPTLYWREG